ncbi:hypothetical protein LJR296_007614 [Cupriavidus necator]
MHLAACCLDLGREFGRFASGGNGAKMAIEKGRQVTTGLAGMQAEAPYRLLTAL